MAKQTNYKINIEINTKDKDNIGLDLSIDEVVRLIKEGFTSGMDSNVDEDFKFQIDINHFPTFKQNLQQLIIKVSDVIAKKVQKIGIKSKHSNNHVIRIIPEELQFNLDGERYLTEIGSNALYDNRGYQYSFDCLAIEELIDIADYIKKRKR